MTRRVPVAALAFALATSACGGNATSLPQSDAPLAQRASSARSPIEHVVVMVQENRTFNDLFATFPGTDGTTTGEMRVGSGQTAKTEPIALKEVALESANTLRHTYLAYKTAYRDGHMDAFNLIPRETDGKPEGTAPYQYVKPADVAPYWDIAKTYAIGDHLFQTQGSGSFTAHQDLIRGGTEIGSSASLIDDPTLYPWGCPAPPKSRTSLITTSLKFEPGAGPFPCTSSFPDSSAYRTLADLLDAKSLSWKYYTPAWRGNTGAIWNAFLVINSVYGNGSEWSAHIAQPQTAIFGDISSGALPAVSWVIPDGVDSDHSGYSSDTGPSWVASVVNAIGKSRYWKSTAIVIVWDDWGGYYDGVRPPKLDRQGGPGFRVPLLVVSPYVPRGEIAHDTYEFGSVVRFIEDNWALGRLGTTDQSSASLAGVLNYKQKPRTFVSIPSGYSRAYFLTRKPSGLPVDTE